MAVLLPTPAPDVLSELMRAGIALAPEQAFKKLVKHTQEGVLCCCAEGAVCLGAMQAAGYTLDQSVLLLEDVDEGGSSASTDPMLSALNERFVVPAPAGLVDAARLLADESGDNHGYAYHTPNLHYALTYLNDELRLSRAAIADLLAQNGL